MGASPLRPARDARLQRTAVVSAGDAVAVGEIAALKHNVDDLARELAEVKSALARVMEELGIKR